MDALLHHADVGANRGDSDTDALLLDANTVLLDTDALLLDANTVLLDTHALLLDAQPGPGLPDRVPLSDDAVAEQLH
jgi:hypothetical protein